MISIWGQAGNPTSAVASGLRPFRWNRSRRPAERWPTTKTPYSRIRQAEASVTSLPRRRITQFTVSLDWRYFRTADPTFKGAVTGAEFDTEIGGHEISARPQVWVLSWDSGIQVRPVWKQNNMKRRLLS